MGGNNLLNADLNAAIYVVNKYVAFGDKGKVFRVKERDDDLGHLVLEDLTLFANELEDHIRENVIEEFYDRILFHLAKESNPHWAVDSAMEDMYHPPDSP